MTGLNSVFPTDAAILGLDGDIRGKLGKVTRFDRTEGFTIKFENGKFIKVPNISEQAMDYDILVFHRYDDERGQKWDEKDQGPRSLADWYMMCNDHQQSAAYKFENIYQELFSEQPAYSPAPSKLALVVSNAGAA